jgi:hypothetical protein
MIQERRHRPIFIGEGTMIAKHILTVIRSMGLMAAMSIIWVANVNSQSVHPPIGTSLPDPPQVVTSFELHAINDPATGKEHLPLKATKFLQ